MKKKKMALWATILGIILMAATGMAQEAAPKFSLKLRGGYGSMSGGDLTAIFDGINEFLQDVVARLPGATISGEIKKAKWGPEFDGELVYNFTHRFGVGLGLGYIRRSADSQAELRIGTLGRALFGWESIVQAMPFTLSGYFNLQIASKLHVFAGAGVGYYFVTMNYKSLEQNGLFGITAWSENEGTAKNNKVGFQGGLGLEYKVSEHMALFIEGRGRYVNLKDWDVDNVYRNSFGSERFGGTFWYVDRHDADTGKDYPSLELGDEEPSGSDFKNARKAEIGLSGIVFNLGVKYRF